MPGFKIPKLKTLLASKETSPLEPVRAVGNVLVVLTGQQMDNDLVVLGCHMSRAARQTVFFVYLMEIPRAIPLRKSLSHPECELAVTLLKRALSVARKVHCEAIAAMLHVREAGPALIEEAIDLNCSLVLMGRSCKTPRADLERAIPYILNHASCRIWLIQDCNGQEPPRGTGK